MRIELSSLPVLHIFRFVQLLLTNGKISLYIDLYCCIIDSIWFQDLFQESSHPHPIVILKDVRYQELEALVKFMYHGEVTVNHDILPGFLRTAETLHVRGLTDNTVFGNSSADSMKVLQK